MLAKKAVKRATLVGCLRRALGGSPQGLNLLIFEKSNTNVNAYVLNVPYDVVIIKENYSTKGRVMR